MPLYYIYIFIYVYPSRYSTGDMEPAKFEYIYNLSIQVVQYWWFEILFSSVQAYDWDDGLSWRIVCMRVSPPNIEIGLSENRVCPPEQHEKVVNKERYDQPSSSMPFFQTTLADTSMCVVFKLYSPCACSCLIHASLSARGCLDFSDTKMRIRPLPRSWPSQKKGVLRVY